MDLIDQCSRAATIEPVDRAAMPVFAQAFSQKACDQTFSEKVYAQAVF